ncbi:MAG: HIT domain-containing protein [Planctomycetes bacterium]|nr:HIT domain-containing protein [Planctomycetota bacterium]
METLWAPWRMKYIREASDERCFFCEYLRQRRDARNLILRRGRTCFAILNRFPYNTGHLMVAPLAHKPTLHELGPEEMVELLDLARSMQSALDRFLKPHGYNLGVNLGRVAGAGVVGHVHLHLVPRWNGDTNFMPVVGGTKVMPMTLGESYRGLRRAMKTGGRRTDNRRRGHGR